MFIRKKGLLKKIEDLEERIELLEFKEKSKDEQVLFTEYGCVEYPVCISFVTNYHVQWIYNNKIITHNVIVDRFKITPVANGKYIETILNNKWLIYMIDGENLVPVDVDLYKKVFPGRLWELDLREVIKEIRSTTEEEKKE